MKRKMIITVMFISLSLLTVSCTKSVESKSISKDMISSTLESVIGGNSNSTANRTNERCRTIIISIVT